MRTRMGLLLAASLCGCVDPADAPIADAPSLGEAEKRPICAPIDNRSLVENDPAVVSDDRFSLARVFEAIRATTPAGYAVPSAPAMFAQLYTDYGACAGTDVDPNGDGLKCRTEEAELAAYDPFTDDPEALHFKPVAIVGRYDMANAKAGTCGESRIVYWKDRGPVPGKAGVIVELHTPPILDANGRPTCAPIATFWASLSSEDDPSARAAKLEAYFFNGLPGMPFGPASARGAGWDGAGQLRSNNFVYSAQWNLREVTWQGRCGDDGCSAAFVLVDTKNSPSDKLFAGTHANAAAFEHWFLGKSVLKLAKARTVNELSLGNPPQFNAYEGISQPFADDPTSVLYAQAASPALRARIADKLVELGSSLSVDNVLDRATSTTCAGCHRISRGADLGGGLTFPAPLGFVHVGDSGQLSPAMTDHFLPRRKQLLRDAVCGKAADPLDGETVSGHALDEPN